MAALLALSAPAFAADGQGAADQTPKSKGSSESVAVKAPIVSSQGDDLVKPQTVTKESQQATALNSSRDGAYVRQTAESYWTSERMANATPIESAEQIADAQAQAAAGDSIKPMDEGKAAPEQVVAKPMAPTANASATKAETADGRVTNYSQTNGKDYVCSGSSVTSSSKRLVITAGHCVHGGGKNGKWHQNWVFVPGYDRGKAPKGKFQAASLRAYKDWIDKGGNNSAVGFNSDVAFVTTHDGTSGGKVNEKVGGHGIIAGGSWTFGVDIFGYPANLDRGQVEDRARSDAVVVLLHGAGMQLRRRILRRPVAAELRQWNGPRLCPLGHLAYAGRPQHHQRPLFRSETGGLVQGSGRVSLNDRLSCV